MKKQSGSQENFFKTASLFEGSLVAVALLLGWIADIYPFGDLIFSEDALFYGVVGTIPLFIVFMAFQQIDLPAIQRIRQLLLDTLGPSLKGCNWADLFVLASIAGFSEEVLFRGTIQPWMESAWGMNIGLLGSSVIFGLLHALTPLYALLATLVSIYLGLFLDYGGERNLFIPIIIHVLYDFLAFLVIMKSYRRQQSRSYD